MRAIFEIRHRRPDILSEVLALSAFAFVLLILLGLGHPTSVPAKRAGWHSVTTDLSNRQS